MRRGRGVLKALHGWGGRCAKALVSVAATAVRAVFLGAQDRQRTSPAEREKLFACTAPAIGTAPRETAALGPYGPRVLLASCEPKGARQAAAPPGRADRAPGMGTTLRLPRSRPWGRGAHRRLPAAGAAGALTGLSEAPPGGRSRADEKSGREPPRRQPARVGLRRQSSGSGRGSVGPPDAVPSLPLRPHHTPRYRDDRGKSGGTRLAATPQEQAPQSVALP
jgi:hypothetical protein